MPKTYNTPKRTFVVKTRLTEEEHSFFMERMKNYEMSQSEFIRQAIDGAVIKPINIYTSVRTDISEECLSARYDWIEQLDTPTLARQLRRLSREDIELLTLLLDGYTQREIADMLNCTQPNIAQKMRRIKKILKNF